jgi:hypothetical protein
MNITLVPEPRLQFGRGEHVDIRYGLMNYGAVDAEENTAPREIALGIIGSGETVAGVERWLARCKDGIPAKASHHPNLFPRFPGFGHGQPLHAVFETAPRMRRVISGRDVQAIERMGATAAVHACVEAFVGEIQYLCESTAADVILCAIPMPLFIAMNASESDSRERMRPSSSRRQRPDFHDLLKARAMAFGRPIQLILPPTYDESQKLPATSGRGEPRRLQDEATRAWNVYVALYYKAGGTPWRVLRHTADLILVFSFHDGMFSMACRHHG